MFAIYFVVVYFPLFPQVHRFPSAAARSSLGFTAFSFGRLGARFALACLLLCKRESLDLLRALESEFSQRKRTSGGGRKKSNTEAIGKFMLVKKFRELSTDALTIHSYRSVSLPHSLALPSTTRADQAGEARESLFRHSVKCKCDNQKSYSFAVGDIRIRNQIIERQSASSHPVRASTSS